MWEQQIANYMPHYLVFHVGGNDVDVVGCSDELIDTTVLRLVNFLNTMKIRYGIRSVMALHITPRTVTRHVFHNDYNKRVRKFNEQLEMELQRFNAITYWKIRGVMNSAYNLLIDGIHFNEEGFIRYYRGVRDAIIQSMEN